MFEQKRLSDGARFGDFKAVEKALQRGAKINHIAGADLFPPLSMAVLSGNKEMVDRLLEIEGVDVDIRDYAGRTSLIIATVHGQEDIVASLLAKGADPWETFAGEKESRYEIAGMSAAMVAAQMGRSAILQQFVSMDGLTPAQLNAVNTLTGRDAASYARHYVNEYCQRLIEKCIDGLGDTPSVAKRREPSEPTQRTWREKYKRALGIIGERGARPLPESPINLFPPKKERGGHSL